MINDKITSYALIFITRNLDCIPMERHCEKNLCGMLLITEYDKTRKYSFRHDKFEYVT